MSNYKQTMLNMLNKQIVFYCWWLQCCFVLCLEYILCIYIKCIVTCFMVVKY